MENVHLEPRAVRAEQRRWSGGVAREYLERVGGLERIGLETDCSRLEKTWSKLDGKMQERIKSGDRKSWVDGRGSLEPRAVRTGVGDGENEL